MSYVACFLFPKFPPKTLLNTKRISLLTSHPCLPNPAEIPIPRRAAPLPTLRDRVPGDGGPAGAAGAEDQRPHPQHRARARHEGTHGRLPGHVQVLHEEYL